jgi:hypothetical protein
MPLSDESFPCQLVNVVDHPADPANGVKASIELQFGCGGPQELGIDAALFVKRLVGIAPTTAVGIGKALIESGERLDHPELAVVGGMAEAEAEAKAHEKLRAVPDPT